ncbi:N-acetyltransferase B complex non catalytic subunit-domain-containing protein [Phyllosticta citribraziliensis]|uniref:N-acetyltransferase B complex non catalytic subunit-domain-containing protein n=1 Tax=Phyllosticta citribraziliensis TaxID=989973 RepID=A0ABR1LC49_9PEZI
MASLSVHAINDKVLYSGSNIKQALKECEKKLQKKPKDPYLLFWKAAVYLKFARDDEAFQQLEALCDSQPAIIDVELLRAIHLRLCEKPGTGPRRNKLWQNAFKATGSDDILITWFESAAAVDAWDDAQLAIVTLKNKNPKNEWYCFAVPAVQQLAAETLQPKDPKTATLMSMLARRTLKMAIDKAMAGDKSADAVTTRRELRLLLQVYAKQKLYKEVLEILDHPKVGIFSPLVVCDLGFVRIKLEVLEAAGMWQELWDFCSGSLKQTHKPDEASKTSYSLWLHDYSLWRGLHLAYRELLKSASDATAKQSLTNMVDSIHDQHDEVTLRVQLLPKVGVSAQSQAEKFENICTYWSVFAKEQICFEDISPYVEDLNEDHQAKFLDFCHQFTTEQSQLGDGTDRKAEARKLRTKANAIKADYFLRVSKGNAPSNEILEEVLRAAVDLQAEAAGKEDFAFEDACALAAMVLVRLYHLEASQVYLLQALAVTSKLLQARGDSRKAQLFHTRLLSYVGNFREGMSTWEGLKIKEILMETLAHLMFTRISVIHPFHYRSKTGVGSWLDPNALLDRILQTSQKITNTLQAFIGADMDTLQYDRLLEIAELKKALTKSLNNKIWVLERRRIERVRGEHVSDSFTELLDDDLESLEDNRDTRRMWSYEHSQSPGFEEYLASGPPPGKYWLALHLLIDETCAVISAPENQRLKTEKLERLVNSPSEEDLAQLTPAERSLIPGWEKLRTLASKVLFGEDLESTPADIEALKSWLSEHALFSTLQDVSIKDKPKGFLPFINHIQTLFLTIELLQATSRLCDTATRLQKLKHQPWQRNIPVKELSPLKTVAQDIFGQVRQRAFDWKNRLSDGAHDDLATRFSSGNTGALLAERLGVEWQGLTDRVLDIAINGAHDSLDGVLSAKLN